MKAVHSNLVFRSIGPEGVDALVGLEKTATPWPWTRQALIQSLEAGHLCVGMFEAGGGELLGYGVVMTVLDEASLLNICIGRQYQGAGLGRALLRHLIDREFSAGAQCMWLEVREGNRVARCLYESTGFVLKGQRKHYYPAQGRREHACIYCLDSSSG